MIETNTVPRDIPVDEGPASLRALRETPRPLTDGERSAIEAAISEFGPVRWVDDPDEWRNDELQPEIEGMAILGVNEPLIDSEGALVPVSLWCGGLCGTWFTYRLERFDGQWQVTGKEGVIAIS